MTEVGPQRRKSRSASMSAVEGVSGLIMLALSLAARDPTRTIGQNRGKVARHGHSSKRVTSRFCSEAGGRRRYRFGGVALSATSSHAAVPAACFFAVAFLFVWHSLLLAG